ncbi:MAG TPA: hypothetical protein VFC00_08220 [Micromonosporaceae bacterium]|nr:hypothetical protein [Micromonosporaceae bacterium]
MTFDPFTAELVKVRHYELTEQAKEYRRSRLAKVIRHGQTTRQGC